MNIETIVEWIPITKSNIVTLRITHSDKRFDDEWKTIFNFQQNRFVSAYMKFLITHKRAMALLHSLDNGVQHTEYYDG